MSMPYTQQGPCPTTVMQTLTEKSWKGRKANREEQKRTRKSHAAGSKSQWRVAGHVLSTDRTCHVPRAAKPERSRYKSIPCYNPSHRSCRGFLWRSGDRKGWSDCQLWFYRTIAENRIFIEFFWVALFVVIWIRTYCTYLFRWKSPIVFECIWEVRTKAKAVLAY